MSDVRISNGSPTLERMEGRQAEHPKPSACRSLFGPVDHEELSRDLQKHRQELEEACQRKWNFDFQLHRPLRGRFEWRALEPGASPDFYSRPTRLPKGKGAGDTRCAPRAACADPAAGQRKRPAPDGNVQPPLLALRTCPCPAARAFGLPCQRHPPLDAALPRHPLEWLFFAARLPLPLMHGKRRGGIGPSTWVPPPMLLCLPCLALLQHPLYYSFYIRLTYYYFCHIWPCCRAKGLSHLSPPTGCSSVFPPPRLGAPAGCPSVCPPLAPTHAGCPSICPPLVPSLPRLYFQGFLMQQPQDHSIPGHQNGEKSFSTQTGNLVSCLNQRKDSAPKLFKCFFSCHPSSLGLVKGGWGGVGLFSVPWVL